MNIPHNYVSPREYFRFSVFGFWGVMSHMENSAPQKPRRSIVIPPPGLHALSRALEYHLNHLHGTTSISIHPVCKAKYHMVLEKCDGR